MILRYIQPRDPQKLAFRAWDPVLPSNHAFWCMFDACSMHVRCILSKKPSPMDSEKILVGPRKIRCSDVSPRKSEKMTPPPPRKNQWLQYTPGSEVIIWTSPIYTKWYIEEKLESNLQPMTFFEKWLKNDSFFKKNNVLSLISGREPGFSHPYQCPNSTGTKVLDSPSNFAQNLIKSHELRRKSEKVRNKKNSQPEF